MAVELGAPGPALRIEYVRTGEGVAVPRHFEVHFTSPAEPLKTLRMTIGVSPDGVPECGEVAISSEPGGPALQRADLQIPLKRLMDQALKWIARPAEFDANGNVVRLGARLSGREAAVSGAPAPRRTARSLTPELLAQVTTIYREANARPRMGGHLQPTQAVADQLTAGVRSTAARWVMKARDAGLLEGGKKARTRTASVRFTTSHEGSTA